MTTRNSMIRAFLVTLALGGAVLATAPASSAATEAPHPTAISRATDPHTAPLPGHYALPGCAETLAPHAGSGKGLRCLRPAATAAPRATSALSEPEACIYQNGPYGSVAWQNGWGICYYNTVGGVYLDAGHNDAASSWSVGCTSVWFFPNRVNSSPYAHEFEDTFGNFPIRDSLGDVLVANDALSSLFLGASC
jgi:hypothetical protein